MINLCLKVGPHFGGLIVKFKHELEHVETMLDGCKLCTMYAHASPCKGPIHYTLAHHIRKLELKLCGVGVQELLDTAPV